MCLLDHLGELDSLDYLLDNLLKLKLQMHFFPDLLCHTDDRFDLIRPKCPGHPPSALSDQHI